MATKKSLVQGLGGKPLESAPVSANDRQVGGSHYKTEDGGEQHWDRVKRMGLGYFRGTATAYIERCWQKNGLEDLQKARHYLDKYIELVEANGGERPD